MTKKKKVSAEEIVDTFVDLISDGSGSLLDDAWVYTEEEYRKEYIKEWKRAIEEVLPEHSSVFAVHRLYNSWTEHSVIGIYSSEEKALASALKELEDYGSSPEQCNAISPDIKTEFTDEELEFSIWITEDKVQ